MAGCILISNRNNINKTRITSLCLKQNKGSKPGAQAWDSWSLHRSLGLPGEQSQLRQQPWQLNDSLSNNENKFWILLNARAINYDVGCPTLPSLPYTCTQTTSEQIIIIFIWLCICKEKLSLHRNWIQKTTSTHFFGKH